MKIVLAGSPLISVRTFEKVINNFDVVAIITQPDKKSGRGLKVTETPVSKLASKHGIKIFKPQKMSEIFHELKDLNFDILLTFAFGQWIPSSILKLGKFKPLNIHGSLLPKYRGAAPIHYAILNGDNEIGITLMEMVKQMDAGDMYFHASRKIDENTSTGDAFQIIDDLAFENIIEWLSLIKSGGVSPVPQPSEFSCAPKISKEFCELKKSLTVKEAMRKIKGLNPFPGSFYIVDGKRVKIYNGKFENFKGALEIEFVDGFIYVSDYQFESRNRVIL